MKHKIFILFVLLINTICIFSQKIYEKPVVEERVELMSIVFRLAEAKEYATRSLPLYIDRVDKYFEKYKNHPLIEYTKTLRKEYGVAYDAVAGFAISLEIKNGKVGINKNLKMETLDNRWQQDSIPKYLALLNDFYKKTNFHKFFKQTKDIRNTAESNFTRDVTEKIDFEWFKRFFGFLPKKKFQIIVSLANGTSNYGPRYVNKDGTEEFYAIIGSWNKDAKGFPIYGDLKGSVRSAVVHEICHSFCNPLIYEYKDELLPQATIFNELNKEKQRKLAYGLPITFLYEILVRACVIQYRNEFKKDYYNKDIELADETEKGFLYITELTNSLQKYTNYRIKYKTFIDFMPEIVKLHDALNPQELYDEIESKKPIITGSNIPNNCDTVDYNIDHITLYFDKAMIIGNNGSTRGSQEYAFPEDTEKNSEWNSDSMQWTVYVKLNPNTEYQIVYPNQFFRDSKAFFHPKETYTLTFKTKPAQ